MVLCSPDLILELHLYVAQSVTKEEVAFTCPVQISADEGKGDGGTNGSHSTRNEHLYEMRSRKA